MPIMREKKRAAITIRLTPSEYDQIMQTKGGNSASVHVRNLIRMGLKLFNIKNPPPPQDKP